MTYLDELFYTNDTKKYQLESNQEFLRWLLISMEETRSEYHLNLKDFENLMNSLTDWYQLRYPDYLIEPIPFNPYGEQLRKLDNISQELNMKQCIARLPYREQWLIEPTYGMKGNTSGNYSEKENGRSVAKGWVGLNLYLTNNRYKSYSILFTGETGDIIYSDIPTLEGKNLEEAYQIVTKRYSSQLDYHELENVVKKYHYEIELRHRLLQLTALKILYSATNPKLGYIRAKKFIEEMNQELGLLLTTTEIDEIYHQYLQNEELFRQGCLNPKKYYK